MRNTGSNWVHLLTAGAMILTLASGCSDDGNPASPDNNNGGNNSRPHFKTVSIEGNTYSPASLTIAVGDTVQWTNNDAVQHTVTSNTGSELESALLNNGQTYQHVFTTAGPFQYHCEVHPGMQASVTVQ